MTPSISSAGYNMSDCAARLVPAFAATIDSIFLVLWFPSGGFLVLVTLWRVNWFFHLIVTSRHLVPTPFFCISLLYIVLSDEKKGSFCNLQGFFSFSLLSLASSAYVIASSVSIYAQIKNVLYLMGKWFI